MVDDPAVAAEEELEQPVPPPHERRWPRPWMGPFLRSLSVLPNATAACRLVGVSHSAAYLARDTNDGFREAWDESIRMCDDLVERHLYEWATVGVPVKKRRTRRKLGEGGVLLEEIVEETESAERSAQLLIYWLKANIPGKYRFAEKLEHGGAGGGPIQFESLSEIDREIAELTAELNRRAAAQGSPPVPVE